jgi:hypothetical protein
MKQVPSGGLRNRSLALGVACVTLGATCGWAQLPDSVPSAVSVRLEPKNGRTDYLMGEPINLTLRFSAVRPGYVVNTERIFGVSERFNAAPADGVFVWHGTISVDTVVIAPLTASGTTIGLRLNDAVIFKNPGTYTVSVTTGRIAEGTKFPDLKWLRVTTNPVTVHIAPMSPDEEAGRVALLSEAIAKTDNTDGLDHASEVKLACLVGDVAARKKVALYLTGRDDITGIRKTGLALSKNKALELQLLDEAWRSLDRIPDRYFLDEMIELRHLEAGIPVPDSGRIMRIPTSDEAAHELAERASYVDEIVATMGQRQGANKLATQAFIDQEKKESDDLSRLVKRAVNEGN